MGSKLTKNKFKMAAVAILNSVYHS